MPEVVRNIYSNQFSATSFTLSSIPQDGKHLELSLTATAAGASLPLVAFNGVTSNYSYTYWNRDTQSGATVIYSNNNVSVPPTNSFYSNRNYKSMNLVIPYYSDTSMAKTMIGNSSADYTFFQYPGGWYTSYLSRQGAYMTTNSGGRNPVTSIEFTSLSADTGYRLEVNVIG